MSKEDKPPPSPNHGLFDPSHLLGAPSLGLAAGLPFPHLTHLPAYPWLGRPAFPPALFGGLGAVPSPFLAHGLPHASAAAEFAALFNMSKHLSEIPSTATSTPSPSKRSRTPTPAPAHQKSSKASTSTSSSSSTKDLHHAYLPFAIDGKDAWHLNGSAFNLKSLTSQGASSSSSRKRRHREGKSSSREGAKVRRSSSHPSAAHSADGRGRWRMVGC